MIDGYAEASRKAKESALITLRNEARAQYNGKYICDYSEFPGSRQYLHTISSKVNFTYGCEFDTSVQVGTEDTYDLYSDGTKILTDSKPVYEKEHQVHAKEETITVTYEFAVFDNAADMDRFIALAQKEKNNKALFPKEYASKGAKSFGGRKTLRLRYIAECLVVPLFLVLFMVFAFMAKDGKLAPDLAVNVIGISTWVFIALLVVYFIIRMRKETSSNWNGTSYHSSLIVRLFVPAYVVISLVNQLWIYWAFEPDKMNWTFLIVMYFIMLFLVLITFISLIRSKKRRY